MPVVAGVDGSPVSAQVVERAIEQAMWRGTDLHLVYVAYMPMVYADVAVDWNEVEEAQRVSVWEGLEETIAGSVVAIEKVDLRGYPGDALVEYAKSVDSPLLVIGTRGRGDLASLVLGSTSHRAIHGAECDVLVVKSVDIE